MGPSSRAASPQPTEPPGPDPLSMDPPLDHRTLTDHELIDLYGPRISTLIDEAVVKLKMEQQRNIEAREFGILPAKSYDRIRYMSIP